MMKAAPLVRALSKTNVAQPRIIHTGQHYDEQMSSSFFQDLGMPEPFINLNVGSASHGAQTGRILESYENHLLKNRPDGVIVLGDVNSTLACALAAVKLHIPCAHVEAGLRSFDRKMPEEINRLGTDAICDLLFCTEQQGYDQLLKEGQPEERVHLVGNLMIDSVLYEADRLDAQKTLSEFGVSPKNFFYSTIHRPANTDDPAILTKLINILDKIAAKTPVLLAAHPRTVQRIKDANCTPQNIQIISPQPYHNNIAFIQQATAVISDSGGIQSEAAVLNTPCLLLRDTTEQPVVIEKGTTELVHHSEEKIFSAIERIQNGTFKQSQPIPLWDGKAGERIAEILVSSWK